VQLAIFAVHFPDAQKGFGAEQDDLRAGRYDHSDGRGSTVGQPFTSGRTLQFRRDTIQRDPTFWVNGRKVCEHEGGFTPFEREVTGFAMNTASTKTNSGRVSRNFVIVISSQLKAKLL
jgi:hypothetical protein